MGKAQPGSQDEQLMRGLWDWAAEMNELYAVGVRVTVAPTVRTGVFLIKAQALEMLDGKPRAIRVQYSQEWPTSKHSTLAGALMATTMHLDYLLGMDALPSLVPLSESRDAHS